MSKKIIVSTEYDRVLTRPSGKQLIIDLIAKGVEVWIVSSRINDEEALSPEWNRELYEVAENLGIDKSKILFSSFEQKSDIIRNIKAYAHIDFSSRQLKDLFNVDESSKLFWMNNTLSSSHILAKTSLDLEKND